MYTHISICIFKIIHLHPWSCQVIINIVVIINIIIPVLSSYSSTEQIFLIILRFLKILLISKKFLNLQGGDGNILTNDVYYYYFLLFSYNLHTILSEFINIKCNVCSRSCNYKLFIVNIIILFFYFYYNYYRHIGIFHDILGRQSTRTVI